MSLHIDPFDRYQERESPIHRLDPRAKVTIALAFILSNLLLPDGAWPAFALAWVGLALAETVAQLGLGYSFKRSFVAIPFFAVAVTAIFAIPGRPIAILSIAGWRWVATDAGLVRFASIVVRSWLSVQMAILLTATTSFPDLIHALRHLRLPQPLVSVIAFMYRYLFLLSDEGVRLLRARDARSAQPVAGGSVPLVWTARVAGHMAGQLFLRSYERSERVYRAMLARGYQGHLLTLRPHAMTARDWAALASVGAALAMLQVFARLAFF